MMTEREAAIFLAVAPSTLRKWRCYGKGPPYYRFERNGGTIRYSREDLEAWLAQARQRSAA
jgi:predicted site-specific integrase-resolvase